MSNNVKIQKVNTGVNINFKGDVKISNLKALTDSCTEGSCDCACSGDFFEKIEI